MISRCLSSEDNQGGVEEATNQVLSNSMQPQPNAQAGPGPTVPQPPP